MKKLIIATFAALPLFAAFNMEDHIVPDSEHGNYPAGGYNTQGYAFPNDPSSNNYFDDPNWPNTRPGDKYNHRPLNSYYQSPGGTYSLPPAAPQPQPVPYNAYPSTPGATGS